MWVYSTLYNHWSIYRRLRSKACPWIFCVMNFILFWSNKCDLSTIDSINLKKCSLGGVCVAKTKALHYLILFNNYYYNLPFNLRFVLRTNEFHLKPSARSWLRLISSIGSCRHKECIRMFPITAISICWNDKEIKMLLSHETILVLVLQFLSKSIRFNGNSYTWRPFAIRVASVKDCLNSKLWLMLYLLYEKGKKGVSALSQNDLIPVRYWWQVKLRASESLIGINSNNKFISSLLSMESWVKLI